MEALLDICCGIDLHKDMLVACVVEGRGEPEQVETKRFGTMAQDIDMLTQWLMEKDCKHVAMESTGVLWIHLYNELVQAGLMCSVVNARHCRNLPGRKTDWNDARWIAHLFQHGMLRASYVANRELQTLRQYTRSLETLKQDESREKNRVEKLLQTTGYKLSSVLSDIFGTTGRKLLDCLVENGRITCRDAEMTRNKRCKHTPQELAQAMQGKMTAGERKLLGFKLRQLDQYGMQINERLLEIEQLSQSFSGAVDCIDSIPGIGRQAAIQIIGEIGVDMSVFGGAEQLASWAGLCPRNDQSAGKKSPPVSCQETVTSNGY